MPQCLHNLVKFIQVRLGRVPSCAWVDERLGAYHDWDLPIHEFSAIEQHLSHCPVCAKAYAEIAALLDSIREQIPGRQDPIASPAASVAEMWARIDAYERARNPQAATAKRVT
jgi:anti-sigma factor RsiW